MQAKSILPAPLPARDDRMQRTLTGLAEAYARQARRLDDIRGMRWFNSLTEARRGYWLQCAGSSRPVDAWRYFKLCQQVVGEVCAAH